jgi:hypothetical protein
MNSRRVDIVALLALLYFTVAWVRANDAPLNFSRLDLSDGRKLKNVVVKSYDAKSAKLLIIANGTAMTIPLAVVPPPFNEKLKAAPASGGFVNTIAAPSRPLVSAADQYHLERPMPYRPPQVIYVPQPAPVLRPVAPDPLLAQADLTRHQAAAQARAQNYFRYEHQYGSTSIIVNSLNFELGVPTAVPGWPGRFESKGTAYIEYYDSRGRSFGRTTSRFEVTTEQKPGEALQVVDFTKKS